MTSNIKGGQPIINQISRAQCVHLRRMDEGTAMPWGQRLKTKFLNVFSKSEEQSEDVEASNQHQQTKQYRLEATRRSPQQSLFWKITTCNGRIGSPRRSTGLAIGINPNQKLAMYLHWMFRVNFLFLFVVMCVMFFALVILFAGFITMAGRIDEECVRIGGELFASTDAAFADAFALSWTTFSTVGYGSTAPALSYQNSSPTHCFFINFICSLEALLGVLYSGFCGAILFGKVLRIQSHAQVIFSDPIVIRFGPGVRRNNDFDPNHGHDESSDDEEKEPCPVLEFRIINRLYNEVGGEIMDATLNVVANVDASDADPSLQESFENDRNSAAQSISGETASDTSSIAESTRFDLLTSVISRNFLGRYHRRDQQALDEDPSARLVSKQIFSKMVIEASDHPFFKRVWLARHVLDEHSPLLKPRLRRQIRRHGGSWPSRLNNCDDVRESLQFNQVLVSLNGVSNVSASDVYAQKIYDFVDINIGYQFVNILYRDGDGSLGVDTDLINDVREQNGGGGETLPMTRFLLAREELRLIAFFFSSAAAT